MPSPPYLTTAVAQLRPAPFRLLASRNRPARPSELCLSSLNCHLAMNRSAASSILRYYLPVFFAAWIHRTISTSTTVGNLAKSRGWLEKRRGRLDRLLASRNRPARPSELCLSSRKCHLAMNRSAASSILRCLLARFLRCMDTPYHFNSNYSGEPRVEPWMARKTAKSSRRGVI